MRILPPRFNRYEGGGEYGFHVDGAVMAIAGGEQLRSDVSCTLFLAGPEEYDGGELVISDTYGEHEVKLPALSVPGFASPHLAGGRRTNVTRRFTPPVELNPRKVWCCSPTQPA